MQTLFELDDLMPVSVHTLEPVDGDEDGEDRFVIELGEHMLDRHLREWQLRKRELEAGEISPDEYMNWKLNWPRTSDQAGRHSQKKAWRKAPEDEA